jgi:hypothetical protein
MYIYRYSIIHTCSTMWWWPWNASSWRPLQSGEKIVEAGLLLFFFLALGPAWQLEVILGDLGEIWKTLSWYLVWAKKLEDDKVDKQIFQWNIYRDKSIEHVSCAMCFPKLSACLPENHDFLFSHDGITCSALQTFLKTWSMWSMPNALWNWPHGFPLIKEQKLSNMLSLWGCQHFEQYFEPFQNWTQKGHVDRRAFLKDNPVPSSTLGKISWRNNGK